VFPIALNLSNYNHSISPHYKFTIFYSLSLYFYHIINSCVSLHTCRCDEVEKRDQVRESSVLVGKNSNVSFCRNSLLVLKLFYEQSSEPFFEFQEILTQRLKIRFTYISWYSWKLSAIMTTADFICCVCACSVTSNNMVNILNLNTFQ